MLFMCLLFYDVQTLPLCRRISISLFLAGSCWFLSLHNSLGKKRQPGLGLSLALCT